VLMASLHYSSHADYGRWLLLSAQQIQQPASVVLMHIHLGRNTLSAELCCVSLLACAADPQQHGPACWVRCGAIQCGQCNQADQRAAARMCRRLPGASLLGGPWSVRRAAEPRAELASGGARSRRRSTRRRGGPRAARLGEDMPAMVAAASRACALQGGGCRRGCGRQRAAGSNGLQRLTGHTEARLRTAEQNVTVGRRRRYVKLPASGSAAGPQADLVAVALSSLAPGADDRVPGVGAGRGQRRPARAGCRCPRTSTAGP